MKEALNKIIDQGLLLPVIITFVVITCVIVEGCNNYAKIRYQKVE